jgi:hypothetical protein
MSKAKRKSAKVKPSATLKAASMTDGIELKSTEKTEINDSVGNKPAGAYEQLHRLNKWLAISYGMQALVLVLLAGSKTLSVGISFLGIDSLASQSNGHTVYTAASQHLFDLSLAQILALSLGISAAFHALVAHLMRPVYESMLAAGENPYRWMENAFSFSLIAVAVGLTVGARDIASLAMIFALSFIAHMLAWQFEHHVIAKRQTDVRQTFVLFTIANLTAWLVIGGYALASVVLGGGVPAYAAIACGLALASVLATGVMLQLYKQGRGKWRNYLFTERTFVLLNFASKTLVIWMLFAAVQ